MSDIGVIGFAIGLAIGFAIGLSDGVKSSEVAGVGVKIDGWKNENFDILVFR